MVSVDVKPNVYLFFWSLPLGSVWLYLSLCLCLSVAFCLYVCLSVIPRVIRTEPNNQGFIDESQRMCIYIFSIFHRPFPVRCLKCHGKESIARWSAKQINAAFDKAEDEFQITSRATHKIQDRRNEAGHLHVIYVQVQLLDETNKQTEKTSISASHPATWKHSSIVWPGWHNKSIANT